MNGVNYAEALVKARRYEITNESAVENDDMIAESVKDAIKYGGARLKSNVGKAVDNISSKVGQKIADSNADKARAAFKKAKENSVEATKQRAFDAMKTAKNADAVKSMGKDALKSMGKKAAIAGGVAAVGAGAAIAAKKIADKKKAAQQNQEEVKENYEYEEYEGLIEAVIDVFMSDEEIMSENASQIAMNTADYLIDNIDSI